MKHIIRHWGFTITLLLCLLNGQWLMAGGGEPLMLSGAGKNGHSAFFAQDHKGNTVVSWLEQEEGAKEAYMVFAVSYDQGISFSKTIKVPGSLGASSSGGESPPKVAYKRDGTIVVLYRKSFPGEKNPYAGDIFQQESKDNGISWTRPESVSPGGDKNDSRGYFDLKTLPNGELGAIWLEGRKKGDHSGRGSFLKFAGSKPEGGFNKPVNISENACQCCKTKLFVDSKGSLHVAFREIFGDERRDISHAFSADMGKSFSSPTNISKDNWVLQGCPHVGPDIAENKEGLLFAWFTMGGDAGIYTASAKENHYAPRNLIVKSVKASRPQVVSYQDGGTVLVWEEMVFENGKYSQHVGLRVVPAGKGNMGENLYFDGLPDAHHPVVTPLEHHYSGIAFTGSTEKNDGVYFIRLDRKNPGAYASRKNPVAGEEGGEINTHFTH